MAHVLKLTAQNGSIELESDAAAPGWIGCYLNQSERTFFGAYTSEYLSKHLLEALTNQHFEPTYEHAGMPIAWVMSLAERHCMLYTSSPFQTQYFCWMDALKDPVAWFEPLTLLPEHRAAWITALQSLAQI